MAANSATKKLGFAQHLDWAEKTFSDMPSWMRSSGLNESRSKVQSTQKFSDKRVTAKKKLK